jgi:hypothetical protein
MQRHDEDAHKRKRKLQRTRSCDVQPSQAGLSNAEGDSGLTRSKNDHESRECMLDLEQYLYKMHRIVSVCLSVLFYVQCIHSLLIVSTRNFIQALACTKRVFLY